MEYAAHDPTSNRSNYLLQRPFLQRSIKHYSNSNKILLVGEGDFSFSLALANVFGSAENMVPTSLDSKEKVLQLYESAHETLSNLETLGATLLHDVDPTTMEKHLLIRRMKFHRIVYNFPHAGFYGKEKDIKVILKHRHLLKMFFQNVRTLLNEDGEVHVTHKENGPYKKWELVKQAEECGLLLKESVHFTKEDYPGYLNRRGSPPRAGDTFFLGDCRTYKFALGPDIFYAWQSLPIQLKSPNGSFEASAEDFTAAHWGPESENEMWTGWHWGPETERELRKGWGCEPEQTGWRWGPETERDLRKGWRCETEQSESQMRMDWGWKPELEKKMRTGRYWKPEQVERQIKMGWDWEHEQAWEPETERQMKMGWGWEPEQAGWQTRREEPETERQRKMGWDWGRKPAERQMKMDWDWEPERQRMMGWDWEPEQAESQMRMGWDCELKQAWEPETERKMRMGWDGKPETVRKIKRGWNREPEQAERQMRMDWDWEPETVRKIKMGWDGEPEQAERQMWMDWDWESETVRKINMVWDGEPEQAERKMRVAWDGEHDQVWHPKPERKMRIGWDWEPEQAKMQMRISGYWNLNRRGNPKLK